MGPDPATSRTAAQRSSPSSTTERRLLTGCGRGGTPSPYRPPPLRCIIRVAALLPGPPAAPPPPPPLGTPPYTAIIPRASPQASILPTRSRLGPKWPMSGPGNPRCHECLHSAVAAATHATYSSAPMLMGLFSIRAEARRHCTIADWEPYTSLRTPS